MKKVMLLGAGEGQMPFLQICKSKGYEVIVVSIAGNYPCFKLADKSYFVDTRNKDEILRIAEQEKIDAILTDQTDVSVPSVAYVAEKLNLRGISYERALKFTNKYLMRNAAQKAGVGVPNFDHAFNLNEAIEVAKKIGYPLIIKPTDSSGSRGVRLIDSVENLKNYFDTAKNFSATGEVILESFINGKEYLVDGFAMNGEYWNLDLGIKEQFNLPGIYVSKMCMFSSVKRITDRIGKMVLDTNKKLVDSIGLPFGITHAEYRYNSAEDKVYLVEIAARGGGDLISSHLTKWAVGFNTNEAVIDYAVEGNIHKLNFDGLDNKVAAWMAFAFQNSGVIKKIIGAEKLNSIAGVKIVSLEDIFVGKKVEKITSDKNKFIFARISADSETDCYKIISEIKNTLSVEIETEYGIEKQIW